MSEGMKQFARNTIAGSDEQAEMLERQKKMFGAFKEDILDEFDNGLAAEPKMKIMSLLSDVQELMEMGQLEKARQMTNVAKMLMMERL